MSEQYPPQQNFPVPPPAPGGYGYAPAAVEPPSTILWAVRGMFAGAALSALGILISFVMIGKIRDAVREELDKSGLAADDTAVNAAVAAGLGIAAVMGLVAIGLWIWMAFANKAGKSWARIVATVLGGLNILTTPLIFAQDTATGVDIAMRLLSLALSIAILVMLWMPASSAYFKARSAR